MVSVAWSTSIPRGDLPTFTVGGVFAQDAAVYTVGDVHGVSRRVDGNARRSAANVNRGGRPCAAGQPGDVAGGGVDHRDGVVTKVGDVDRAVGHVNGNGRRVSPHGCYGCLVAAASHIGGVAAGGVDHRDGVVTKVGDVDRARCRVDGESQRGRSDLGGWRLVLAAGAVGSVAGRGVDHRERVAVSVR